MKVHIIKPYSITKNLGKAYNEAMALIPEADWACLMDYDTMFLTPQCGKILENYGSIALVDTPPAWAPLLTCYTNRINPQADHQLLNGHFSEDDSVSNHIAIAEQQSEQLFKLTEITRVISGFLMMVHKQTWNNVKFSEDMKCLGVDNDYSRRILSTGRKILRMEGLYIWHSYRLTTGITNKDHLL